MSKQTHPKLVRKRRKRREKLVKLRERYLRAKSEKEKEKMIEKLKKIAPWLSKEEFLRPIGEESRK